MPIVPNESAAYGYEDENRHMVRAFRAGERPAETFEDGVAVTEILMAAYMSAERGATLDFPPAGLESFVPAVARAERTTEERSASQREQKLLPYNAGDDGLTESRSSRRHSDCARRGAPAAAEPRPRTGSIACRSSIARSSTTAAPPTRRRTSRCVSAPPVAASISR